MRLPDTSLKFQKVHVLHMHVPEAKDKLPVVLSKDTNLTPPSAFRKTQGTD